MQADTERLFRQAAALGDTLLPPRRAAGVSSAAGFEPRDVLPLADDRALVVLTSGAEVLVAPLAPEGHEIRRASPGDGVFAGLVDLIMRGERLGRFGVRRLSRLPEEEVPAEAQKGVRWEGERAIDDDQSNESVVVGERVVLKLFPFTAAGPQRGVDLPMHLAEAGFDAVPTPVGALTWADDGGRDVLLATATAFLPGARDGWDWYVESLLSWLDGSTDEAAARPPAAELGVLTARLHVALAMPTSVIPAPVRTVGPGSLAAWRRRARADLSEALAVTEGPEGTRLRAIAERAYAALETFGDRSDALAMWIHGDLHVGQFLRWEGGLAVTDFDGDPVAPIADRRALESPMRDLASLVRSVDHVGRIAQRRREGRSDEIARWIEGSVSRVVHAYRDTITAGGRAELFDERLLRPFEVAQEAHEYVYAARFLPRWRYVPDLAMAAMFPEGESTS